jgi:uncharacterized protein YfbU (UPF0304 family)
MDERDEFRLTHVQRAILYNQYRILSQLSPNMRSYYSEKMQIVRRGFIRDYDEAIDCVCDDRYSIPKDVSDEAIEILEVYVALARGVEALDDTSGIDQDDLRFAGFYNQDWAEHRYEVYLAWYIEHAHADGRFEELDISESLGLGSPVPRLPMYRAMMAEWVKMGKPMWGLTREQMLSILEAKHRVQSTCTESGQ